MEDIPKKAIIFGSTASLPHEYRKLENQGIFEVPFKIRPDDDQSLEFLDNADVDPANRQRFIKYVQSQNHRIVTSQPNASEYLDALNRAVVWGADEIIIPAVISPKLSGAGNSINTAVNDFKTLSPVPVYLPEKTTKVSLAEGLDVLKAMSLRGAGKNGQEIIKTIDREYDNCEVSQIISDLEPLRKAGRVGRAGKLIAGILGVKAIISLDLEAGELFGIGKARGFEKYTQIAIDHIAAKMGDAAIKLCVAYFEPNEINIDKLVDRAKDQLNIVGNIDATEQSYVISSYTSVNSAALFAEKAQQ